MENNFNNQYWKETTTKLQDKHIIAASLLKEDDYIILDVGCGDGVFMEYLKTLAPDNLIYGIDSSEEAIRKCRTKGLYVDLYDMNNFKSIQIYDVILFIDVLEHTLNPADLIKKYFEYTDKIIISVPNFGYVGARLEALKGNVPKVLNERKGHSFYFTEDKLKEIVRRAGGKIEEIKYYFPLMNKPRYGWFMQGIGEYNPSLFATCFIIKIKKV